MDEKKQRLIELEKAIKSVPITAWSTTRGRGIGRYFRSHRTIIKGKLTVGKPFPSYCEGKEYAVEIRKDIMGRLCDENTIFALSVYDSDDKYRERPRESFEGNDVTPIFESVDNPRMEYRRLRLNEAKGAPISNRAHIEVI